MPPDGDWRLNVVVRDGKVKGGTEGEADRSVSTGGYTAILVIRHMTDTSSIAGYECDIQYDA